MMKNRNHFPRGYLKVAKKTITRRGILALAMPLAISANSQIAAQEEKEYQGLTLEEVIVTAQKRQENLQDVPISVAAVDGDKISNARIQRLDELSGLVPNLQINQDSLSDRISIRGIGSGEQAGFEQSVGTFVDGVYRGRGVQSRFAFMDLAGVEVLRGPQGTLFGKNTVAGALNIRTAKPTEALEGSIAAAYDLDFEATEITAHVSGALTDSVRARIALQSRDQEEGWVKNALSGEDYPNVDEWAGRISLEMDLSVSTLLSLKYEQADWNNSGMPWEPIVAGPLAAVGVEGDLDLSINQADIDLSTGIADPVQDFGSLQVFGGDTQEFALTLVHDFDAGATFTTIASTSKYTFDRYLDVDFSPVSLVRFDDTEKYDQSSLELRYASNVNAPVSYIVGGFYQQSNLLATGISYANIGTFAALTAGSCAAGDPALDAGAAFACATNVAVAPIAGFLPGVQRSAVLDQNAEVAALFAQATWSLSDSVRVTGGLRYTDETKSAQQSVVGADYQTGNLDQTTNAMTTLVAEQLFEFTTHHFDDLDRRESSFTWSLNGQWDATEYTMVYASASTGFKAGGFNSFYTGAASGAGANPDDADFEEEEALALELGAKMTLLEGAAELNLALFRTNYDDLQVAVFSGNTTFNVENAAEAVTQGLELDGRWMITENLILSGGAAYTDFEFESFPNQACTNDQFLTYRQDLFEGALGANAAGLTAAHCAAAGINDLEGRTAVDTPEFSASLSAEYQRELGDFIGTLTLDYSFNSRVFRQGDLDPILETNDINSANAGIRLEPTNGAWQVNILVKNLTDESDITSGNDVPLSFGTHVAQTMAPRSVFVGAKLNF